MDQLGEVCRVQAVTDLEPVPAEPNVPQRAASEVAVDPVGKDPLVGATELPRASEHAAPIDPNREAEGLAVLQCQSFTG